MVVEVIIRTGPGEQRVSLTENGRLSRVLIDRTSDYSVVDGIYLGRISGINRDLNAAFVNIGLDKMGFLAAVDAQNFDRTRERPKPIGQLFTEGANVLVQVTRDPNDGKGAKLTTRLGIRTANIVLTPGRQGVSVSRHIEDQRASDNMIQMLEVLVQPDAGFIIRTRAADVSRGILIREAKMLSEDWKRIKSLMTSASAPSVLLKPPFPILRFIQEIYGGDLKRIIVADQRLFREMKKIFEYGFPEFLAVLEFYNGADDIFSTYGLNDQWEELFSRIVQLPSGGSLIIEETAALTAVDVNSGKRIHGSYPEDGNLALNLEAVRELARQIMLRNLSGQVVIDLLPQKNKEKRDLITKAFQEAISRDGRNINLIGFTRLGLFELTRRRRSKSLGQQIFEPSENLKSPVTLALEALYQVQKEMQVNPGQLFAIDASPKVAEVLCSGGALNAKRELEKGMIYPIEVRIHSKHVLPEVSIRSKISGN